MSRRGLIGTALLLAVLASGWLALQLRPDRSTDAFVGPPRADYTMDDYQLVVLDAMGNESFTVSGPQLSRDPLSAEIFLERPRFTFPSEEGTWTATSLSGWVNARADELRLTRAVELDGPQRPAASPVRVRTEALHVRPDERTAHSPVAVSIDRGNSILTGRGLDADLDTRRLQLHAEVRIRHEPIPRR